ncbi:hypothetical protein MalM25_21800 [Planctomycetes bacterium MalM25]|nr:hypothetical protein MalM25_21800 [Planctomycetes bacterium MalM25]
MFAYDSGTEWTAIYTRMVIGVRGKVFTCSNYEAIRSITSHDFPPPDIQQLEWEEIGKLKSSWECLSVTTEEDEVLKFWVPAGKEAFAFWNILLMLSRMASR